MSDDEAEKTGEFLTYAENPGPEVIWRCTAGHEMGVKGNHLPPTIKMMMGDGTSWIDSGPVCFACMGDFLKTHFRMEPVLPPAEEPAGGV